LLQLIKAKFPILVTPSRILTVVISLS
jgi:hypothetical protein